MKYRLKEKNHEKKKRAIPKKCLKTSIQASGD